MYSSIFINEYYYRRQKTYKVGRSWSRTMAITGYPCNGGLFTYTGQVLDEGHLIKTKFEIINPAIMAYKIKVFLYTIEKP